MIVAALLLLQTGMVAAPPPESDVVVIGQRVVDTGRELQECLALGCAPEDDIALSLAHADAQLIAGDYGASRRTLLAARGRNGRFAADLPIDVAELQRRNARLASLNGHAKDALGGIRDVTGALRSGLSGKDARIVASRLEVAQELLRTKRWNDALRQYDRVAAQARKAGMVTVEGGARFQQAMLLSTLAVTDGIYADPARYVVELIATSRQPEWAPFRLGVRVIPIMAAKKEDRPRLLDALVATIEPRPADDPLLLYRPVIDPADFKFGVAGGGDTEWADFRFRIAADGRVEDVVVVRQSPGTPRRWIDVMADAVANRRYAPMRFEPGQASVARMERATFISDRVVDTRTRVVARAAERRVDMRDLTDAPRAW